MAKGYRSPFGLNRWVLLCWHAIVLIFSGYSVANLDILRETMLMSVTAKKSETDFDRRVLIEGILNFGFGVSIASSWLTARFAARRNVKWVAIWSIILHAFGVLCVYCADDPTINYAGMLILGAVFSAAFNAHTHLTALWPTKSEMVMDVISAVPDLTCLVFLGIYVYAVKFGGGDSSNVVFAVQLYVGVLAFIAFMHMFLTSSQPYSELVGKNYAKKMANTPKRQHKYSALVGKLPGVRRLGQKLKREEENDVLLSDLTLMEQLTHPLFFMTLVFFAVNVIRKYHLQATFRYTVENYALQSGKSLQDANTMVLAFDVSSALCWISTTFMTRITMGLGSLNGSIFLGVTMLFTSICYAIPIFELQWVTVLLQWLWSTFFFGHLFVSVGEYFGIRNTSHVQGTIMSVVGVIVIGHSAIMERLKQPYIKGNSVTTTVYGLPLYQFIHWVMAALGIINILIPFYEASLAIPFYKKCRRERDAKREQVKQRLSVQAPAQRAPAQQGPQKARPQKDEADEDFERAIAQLIGREAEEGSSADASEMALLMMLMAQLGRSTGMMDPNELADKILKKDGGGATEQLNVIAPFHADGSSSEDEDDDDEAEGDLYDQESQQQRRSSAHRRSYVSSASRRSSRILSEGQRKSLLASIGQFGVGAAYLNEDVLAQMAGQLIASEVLPQLKYTKGGKRQSRMEEDEGEEEKEHLLSGSSSVSDEYDESSNAGAPERFTVQIKSDHPPAISRDIPIPKPEGHSRSGSLRHDIRDL